MTDQPNLGDAQGPSNSAEYWSTGKALRILSIAWLVVSVGHVLLTLGAHLLLGSGTPRWIGLHRAPAAVIAVGAFWISVLMIWQVLSPANRGPADGGLVPSPLWMVLYAAFFQIAVLLTIAHQLRLPPTIALSGALSIFPIGSLVHDCVRRHLQQHVPQSFPTRRWDAPGDQGDA